MEDRFEEDFIEYFEKDIQAMNERIITKEMIKKHCDVEIADLRKRIATFTYIKEKTLEILNNV